MHNKEDGHEVPDVFDGVLYWSCPHCRGAWHYWTPDWGRRFDLAERYVGMANFHAGVTDT